MPWKKTWYNLTHAGNEHFRTAAQKKANAIGNEISIFFASVLFIFIFITIFLCYWSSHLGTRPASESLIVYLPPLLATLGGILFCYQRKKSTGYYFYPLYAYFAGVAFVIFMSICTGKDFGMQNYLFALLGLPFFYLGRQHRKILIASAAITAAGIFACHAYNHLFPPLFPFHPHIAFTFYHFIMLPFSFLTFVLTAYYSWDHTHSAEELLMREQQTSENLLLNILPRDVAEELKLTGKAEPVEYESVTVMFTDFVGFTRVAELLSPKELLDELDKCFSYFDCVMKRYNLEKLKTIGDSFMCAGGIPVANTTHFDDCAMAALAIRDFMRGRKEIKSRQGKPYWDLRIGMHTGPLVAGVVGMHKFAYDIWGDTVNTASRLESSGHPSEINISRTTYELVQNKFTCTFRGHLVAKGKGEIEMYFLHGRHFPETKGDVNLSENAILSEQTHLFEAARRPISAF